MEKYIIKPKEIKIPAGVNVLLDKSVLNVKGPKGENTRDFSNPRVHIEKKDSSIIVTSSTKKQTRRDKMYVNTAISHIRSMVNGVVNGYEAKLKICSGHFPMSVSIDNKNFIVKNFLGEKIPRKTTLYDNINVKLEGDFIKISGCDKEKVGLTAARIERTCKIKGRDLRVFQDGIWLLDKVKEVKNG